MSTLQAPSKRKQGDHVVYTCLHCGETFRAFNKCHINCVKPEVEPEVEPVTDMSDLGWIYVTERNPEADGKYNVSIVEDFGERRVTTVHTMLFSVSSGWNFPDVYAWLPLILPAPLPDVAE